MRNHNSYPGSEGDQERDEIDLEFYETVDYLKSLADDLAGGYPESGEEEIGSEEEEHILPWEEVSEQIVENAQNIMRALGLKDPESIDEESIKGLGEDIYWDPALHSLEDLYFHVLTDEVGEDQAVKFEDLVEAVEVASVDIFRIQTEQTEKASKTLIGLGFDQTEILEWGLMGTPRQKRAIRRMGWLLDSPVMEKEATRIKNESKKRGPFKFKQIALVIPTWLEAKDFHFRLLEGQQENWTSRKRKAYSLDRVRLDRCLAVGSLIFRQDIDEGVYDLKE